MVISTNFLARIARWQFVLLLGFLIAGCAGNPERPTMNFRMSPSVVANPPMWPSPQDGEIPRYVYAGQLIGEQNFQAPKDPRKKTGFLNWVLGLFDNDAAPLMLQRPQSGMVDATGRIFVTDASRKAVYVFDQQEGRLVEWEGIEGKHFIGPAGIASGEAGEVYVADAEHGVVYRLNRKGERIAIIGKRELRRPLGVAFDMTKRELYVSDTYEHNVKVYDLDGRMLRILGRRGELPGELNYPTYIAFAKNELYVADTMNARVQVLDAQTGKANLVIDPKGLNVGSLVRPKGVAVDSEGNIYVIESYFDYLLVYNRKGQFLMPLGGTGNDKGQFLLPSGVWIDDKDRVYVADMFNSRVTLFQFLGGGSESE
ncbi:MAG: 6-bladed beta-propeller [Pseudomonadota bacterium]